MRGSRKVTIGKVRRGEERGGEGRRGEERERRGRGEGRRGEERERRGRGEGRRGEERGGEGEERLRILTMDPDNGSISSSSQEEMSLVVAGDYAVTKQ